MDTLEVKPRRAWRRHSPEFKARVIEACRKPEVSVASVALANGLNANLLRTWVVAASTPAPAKSLPAEPGFLPLAITAATPTTISIVIRRGAASVQIDWPLLASAECGVWLRTWLK